jgi:hypothetical protein
MMSRLCGGIVATGALGLALSVAGCEEKAKPSPAPPQDSARPGPSAGASASASAAAPEAAPWFVGTWTSSYEAQHYLIEMEKKQGGIAAWKNDDGAVGSGSGKLNLTVDANRVVTGTSGGALGELVASGQLDEETLRVRLTPKQPGAENAFSGMLIARRKGDAFEGTLQASTGDSKVVRDAPIKLSKTKSAPGAE